MFRNLNLQKTWPWWLLYIVFGATSCWATATSLRIFLHTIPAVVVYLITIGVFVIASMSTKWFIEGCSKFCRGNRNAKFWGGLVGIVGCWMLFSTTTNVHSFVYRSNARQTVANDVSTTSHYLNQIINNTNKSKKVNDDCEKLRQQVAGLKASLENEILRNKKYPGVGPKAREALNKIGVLLGTQINEVNTNANTNAERQELYRVYEKNINDLTESRCNQIKSIGATPDKQIVKRSKAADHALDSIQNLFDKGAVDIYSIEYMKPPLAKGITDIIADGYVEVANAQEFVAFKKGDKKLYNAAATKNADGSAKEIETRTSRLMSVFYVWGNPFAYSGFAYGLIFSILCDIAAFIFFYMARK